MPIISIIVPVYNAEAYLSYCLESLINQTFQNIEIVCVNDGSKDGSLSILKDYQIKDKRIRIIDQPNGGVSQARNEALRIVSGEYVMFVDADDWLEADTCENAIQALKTNDVDVVMWSYVSEMAGVQSFKSIFAGDRVFDEIETKKMIHRRFVGILGNELARPELADSLCPVWGKLYRTDVIVKNQIRFIDLSEIGTYEDGMFNLEVFNHVNRTMYLDKCYYHHRKDNRGSVTSGYLEKLDKRWQNLFEKMRCYISENGLPDSYVEALNNRIALSVLGLMLNIQVSNKSFIRKRNELKQIIVSEDYKKALLSLDTSAMPNHWKLFYNCAKCGSATALLLAGKAIQILRSARC